MVKRHSPKDTKVAMYAVVAEMLDKMVKGELPSMTLHVRTETNI